MNHKRGIQMKSTEEYTHHGLSKVERYKWGVQDTVQGTYMDISKHDLRIDDAYQRDAVESKVMLMAKDWSWIGCGAIIVALRPDGFWVIDGQHRVMAARKRTDIDDLPCMVFEVAEKKMEAAGFLSVNTNRKPLTAVDRFKAKCEVGDPLYLKAKALIDASGRHATRGSVSNGISCIEALASLIRDATIDEADSVYWLTHNLCAGRPISSKILTGLQYIFKKMRGNDQELKRLRKRLLDIGFDEIDTSIRKACTYYAQGGSKIYAEGIITAANKGMRIRFAIEGSTNESAI